MSTDRPPRRLAPVVALAHSVISSPVKGASSAQDSAHASDGISLGDLLRVLRRRWGLVLGTIGVTLALTVLAVMREPPRYRATAVLRIADARRAVTSAVEHVDPLAPQSVDQLLSQVQLLRSRGVIGSVADAEGLRLYVVDQALPSSALADVSVAADASPETLQLRFGPGAAIVRRAGVDRSVPYGGRYAAAGVAFGIPKRPAVEEATIVVESREQAVDRVLENLRVAPRASTDVVDVSYTADEPAIAQRVVNRLAESYRDASMHSAQERSRLRRAFLEAQLREVEAKLVSAENELSAFRSRQQSYNLRERLQAAQSSLLSVEMRREEMNADRRVYESLLARLERPRSERNADELRGLIAAPGLSDNPVVTQLFEQLERLEATRDSLTTGEWRSAPTNPDVARIDQMIAVAERRLVGAVRGHLATLGARVQAFDAMRARSAAATSALPGAESEEETLTARVETHRAVTSRIREEYQNARMAEAAAIGQVEIVDRAALPYLPVARMRALKLVLGMAMGLMLGSGLAFLVESTRARIHRREQLEEELLVPVLSVIPRIETTAPAGLVGWMRAASRDVGAAPDVGFRVDAGDRTGRALRVSPAATEAFRLLRSSLAWALEEAPSVTLAVASALPQEGKSTTSANLAAAYASAGRRTVLVDCDLRRTRLSDVFGVMRNPGLAQVLHGHIAASSAIRSTHVPGLYFLPAGESSTNPADLLSSDAMTTLVASLSKHFEVVVLDTPPLLPVADGAIVARLATSVLLVIRAGVTDRKAVSRVIRQLASSGTRVAGAVLVDTRTTPPTYGGDNYYLYAPATVSA